MKWFCLEGKDQKTNARLGFLRLPPLPQGKVKNFPGIPEEAWTKERVIETPCFMPVGTQATVKGVLPEQLWQTGSRMILCNTYHLLSRPGEKRIKNLDGLHRMMNWPGGIITDSGGFQVYSLAKKREIDDRGVTFQHHIDGQTIRLEPENVLESQRSMATDIAMVLDECIELPKTRDEIARACSRTLHWAKCSREHMKKWEGKKTKPLVFGICQGGLELDLRQENLAALRELNFDGYALGGFSVGEPNETSYALVKEIAPLLPEKKPRYLMGVGTPEDLLNYVGMGLDLFDCVLPTRNARTGQLFTRFGKVAIANARFAEDSSPVEEGCECPTCKHYTRAYLRHLFLAKEILSSVLNTLHNLFFYQHFMQDIRQAIRENRFSEFRQEFLELQKTNESD